MSTLVLFITECLHNINVYYYGIYFTSTWLPLRLADPPVAMLPGWILITVESDSWLVTPFYISHPEVHYSSGALYSDYKDNNYKDDTYKDIMTLC